MRVRFAPGREHGVAAPWDGDVAWARSGDEVTKKGPWTGRGCSQGVLELTEIRGQSDLVQETGSEA